MTRGHWNAGMGLEDHSVSPEPLKGIPVRESKHIRFDDNEKPVTVEHKVQLRGVPLAKGHHIRFD